MKWFQEILFKHDLKIKQLISRFCIRCFNLSSLFSQFYTCSMKMVKTLLKFDLIGSAYHCQLRQRCIKCIFYQVDLTTQFKKIMASCNIFLPLFLILLIHLWGDKDFQNNRPSILERMYLLCGRRRHLRLKFTQQTKKCAFLVIWESFSSWKFFNGLNTFCILFWTLYATLSLQISSQCKNTFS